MFSMICMLCSARVTCPWEQEIEPVALAAGWIEFPKNARRRSPASICGDCAQEARVKEVTECHAEIASLRLRALRAEKRVREIAELPCIRHPVHKGDPDPCSPADRCTYCRCRAF